MKMIASRFRYIFQSVVDFVSISERVCSIWNWYSIAFGLPFIDDPLLKRQRRCGGWVLRQFRHGIIDVCVIWHGGCPRPTADTGGDGFLGGGVLLPDAMRHGIDAMTSLERFDLVSQFRNSRPRISVRRLARQSILELVTKPGQFGRGTPRAGTACRAVPDCHEAGLRRWRCSAGCDHIQSRIHSPAVPSIEDGTRPLVLARQTRLARRFAFEVDLRRELRADHESEAQAAIGAHRHAGRLADMLWQRVQPAAENRGEVFTGITPSTDGDGIAGVSFRGRLVRR